MTVLNRLINSVFGSILPAFVFPDWYYHGVVLKVRYTE
jgi:hypothetical protein